MPSTSNDPERLQQPFFCNLPEDTDVKVVCGRSIRKENFSSGSRPLECSCGLVTLGHSRPLGKILFLVTFSVLLALGAPLALPAQTSDRGTVVGHVRGPGGVSVPGATVQITELQSGERKATWTDEAGNYVLEGLAPGT